jgi:hypothetical protein
VRGHEHVPRDDAVAAAPRQPRDVPVVEDLQIGHRYGGPQHLGRAAVGLDAGRQEVPVGVLATGGEGRGAVDDIAAVRRDRDGVRDERAADPDVRAGEDLVLGLVREERGDVRTPGLVQRHEAGRTAPGGDLAQHLDLRAQPTLVTAVPPGDVHPVDPGVRQRRHRFPGHPSLLLGAQRVLAEEGLYRLYAFDEAGV